MGHSTVGADQPCNQSTFCPPLGLIKYQRGKNVELRAIAVLAIGEYMPNQNRSKHIMCSFV